MLDRRGVKVEAEGRSCLLKWHRGRRFAGDVAFSAERIIEGMALGASVEIDLLRHAEDGFVVLHDEALHSATTGSGPVRAATRATLAGLYLRDDAGNETPHRVMLLEELTALIGQTEIAPGSLLQLDMKSASPEMAERDLAAFAAAVAPIAACVILSSGDAEAVARLSQAVPAMPIGYDPCYYGAIENLQASLDFSGFVDQALAASPQARMVYLHYALVLFAEERGFPLIKAFHDAGRTVDAYTIQTADAAIYPQVMRLLALGADQITTDDPVGLERLISGAQAEG